MNLLPALQSILDDLQHHFGGQIEHAHAPQPDELYLHVPPALAGALCSTFYKKHEGRLAGVFAEDARATERAFHVYYLYALDAAHGFILVRVPVPADRPELLSLTDAVPAVNWQEREIQDLFGLELVGHPNPRRCCLHDDWPDVHPLRKDFDLRTNLPAFQGERHKFRKVEGEGVFQVPVGPVHAGIIEPGHFLFSVAGEPVLFFAAGNIHQHCHSLEFRRLGGGLMRTMPATALLLGLAAVAVCGLPPFGMFFSELTVLMGGFAGERPWISSLALLALLMVFCGVLTKLAGLLPGPAGTGRAPENAGAGALATLVLPLAALLVFTFWLPASVHDVMDRARNIILGVP